MYYIRRHLAIVLKKVAETATGKAGKKSERNRQGLPSDEIAVTKKLRSQTHREKNPEKKITERKMGLIPDKPPLLLANYPYKDRIFPMLVVVGAADHCQKPLCLVVAMVSVEKGKAFFAKGGHA